MKTTLTELGRALIMLIGIGFILLIWVCVANAATIQVQPSYSLYADDRTEPGPTLKVKLSWDRAYLWGSYSRFNMIESGQPFAAVDMGAVGGGIRHQIVPGLFVNLELGVYKPWVEEDRNNFNEAFGLYMMKQPFHVAGAPYKYLKYEVQPNIGGSIGLETLFRLSQRVQVGLSASYRYLSVHEEYSCSIGAVPVIVTGYRDLSGFTFGATFWFGG